MRFIVTGGAGFIGSNIVRALSDGGHEVTVVDNFHTGSDENLSRVNGVDVIRCPSGSIPSDAVQGADGIFHLGMPSSSPMYAADSGLCQRTVDEFRKILDWARLSEAKLVFASTSSLYGMNRPPHREDMDVQPIEGYTESRLMIERLADEYHRIHDVSAVGLRLFSVYGPNEKAKGMYANVLSQFLWSMQKGEAPVIYGDGTQTRDFVFVEDVARAFTTSMSGDVDSGIFNVGTGVPTSMNDVVGLINDTLGTEIEPEHVRNPIPNYVMHTQSDCGKAESVLGFSAKCGIEDGIKRIIGP
jgi:UDP-glucose 4-epimerase